MSLSGVNVTANAKVPRGVHHEGLPVEAIKTKATVESVPPATWLALWAAECRIHQSNQHTDPIRSACHPAVVRPNAHPARQSKPIASYGCAGPKPET